jgi:hypothetical protein
MSFVCSRFERRGSMDWTVGKLIGIIILVVVMVLVIYGLTTNGFNPLINVLREKQSEVLIMMGLNEDIYYEDCYSSKVVDLGGGREFLVKMGFTEQDIILNVCRNRMCNFSDGLKDYRSVNGEMQVFLGSDWVVQSAVFEGNLGFVKTTWELYNGLVDLLEKKSMRDFYNSGMTGKFVLFGDGAGLGDSSSFATWQNGKWMVSSNGGKEIEILSDEVAIGMFVKAVNDGVLGIGKDDVVWSVEGSGWSENGNLGKIKKGGLVSREDSGYESAFNDVVSNYNENAITADVLYEAIMNAEHRGNYDVEDKKWDDGYNPWIRTVARGTGSSAYGPTQLTKGLAEGFLKNNDVDFSDAEKDYLNRFVDQGLLFLVHGDQREEGVIDAKQFESNKVKYSELGLDYNTPYDARYDYGGGGSLTSSGDKALYEAVIKKMLWSIYVSNGKNLDLTWKEWRFGAGNDLFDLFFKYKKKLLAEAVVVSGDVEDLKNAVDGESIFVDGKVFVLSVEESQFDYPVVVAVSGGDQYRFIFDGNVKTQSNIFDNVELRSFPISLVEFSDGRWKDVGNEEYYRLPKDLFDQIYQTSIVNEFLKEKCR